MSNILTFAADVLQSGIGLWIGLAGGTGLGLAIAWRRDNRHERRIAEELATNAELRSQLAQAKRRNLFSGQDTMPRADRSTHGQPWPNAALDAAADAAAQVR